MSFSGHVGNAGLGRGERVAAGESGAARSRAGLLRHLYEVIALEQPVDIPWGLFFGGEPGQEHATTPAPGMQD